MPPRREPRPSPAAARRSSDRRSGAARSVPASAGSLRLPALLGPRAWLSAGLVAVGALLGASLLGLIWPQPDREAQETLELTPASLAEKPGRAITVLVIGLDSERIGDALNHAAPAGPAAADALLLVRVNRKGPLQVLNLPIELAITLPGEAMPVGLGSLYQRGGVALTADVVRDVVGLEPPRPDRYLVVPRSALRKIVDSLGGLELNPPGVMQYHDKAQNYRIDLQGGLQRLDGKQVEQLVRYRDVGLGDSGRRLDHQLVESALRDRFSRPEQLALLPNLLRDLQTKVETNLTAAESLSLLAAGLDTQRAIQFTRLALKPATKEYAGLRQLDTAGDRPIWQAP